MTACRWSDRTVPCTLEQVSETSSRTGKPTAALVSCPLCHRTGLRARVWPERISLQQGMIARLPNHNTRGES